ncbi:MAG: helix-turn-helix transcriptional regulator [Clostridia bacterium]|nr:helix-turn-helix transcriptional regulator [Clostridia bacterium]
MEIKEFFINSGDERVEAFIYDDFFVSSGASSAFHSHKYAEVHFTECGECRIYTKDTELISGAGTVTVIPAGVMHRLVISDSGVRHKAFRINCRVEGAVQKHFSPELFAELGVKIREYPRTKNFTSVAAYLTFICKDFVGGKTELCRVSNEEFIISEFFANNYSRDATLSELAAELQLCTKQTARLVEKYMGASFSKTLVRYRINAAKLLLDSAPSLTLAEIAQLVGYRSYSGFWKAFRALEQKQC